jgi:alanine dehydrogenase
MKLGILKETKIPPDSRVALTPTQCRHLINDHELEIRVQKSDNRCYKNEEYRQAGIILVDDISDCDILLGVKEVRLESLIPDQTYLFFSHTMKEQPYNRDLLREILLRHIKLIDYEALTDKKGNRLIAFGVFAGMVGAYNGMMAYGKRTGKFTLDRMYSFHDYEAAKNAFAKIRTGMLRIVLTGTGRVGNGAAMVLKDMGIREVSPDDYLNFKFQRPVFTQLGSKDYARHKTFDTPFDRQHFHAHPEEYESSFKPFLHCSDMLINGMYWDNHAPGLFSREDMFDPDFRIQVIADITCDIAPEASIPCTVRASTIKDPIYGYDPKTDKEAESFKPGMVDIIAVDNLPNELPRDASHAFGNMFTKQILSEFFRKRSEILDRATITTDGRLTKHYRYLRDYVGAEYEY